MTSCDARPRQRSDDAGSVAPSPRRAPPAGSRRRPLRCFPTQLATTTPAPPSISWHILVPNGCQLAAERACRHRRSVAGPRGSAPSGCCSAARSLCGAAGRRDGRRSTRAHRRPALRAALEKHVGAPCGARPRHPRWRRRRCRRGNQPRSRCASRSAPPTASARAGRPRMSESRWRAPNGLDLHESFGTSSSARIAPPAPPRDAGRAQLHARAVRKVRRELRQILDQTRFLRPAAPLRHRAAGRASSSAACCARGRLRCCALSMTPTTRGAPPRARRATTSLRRR